MKSISDMIPQQFVLPAEKSRRLLERGELFRYFMQEINPQRIKDGYPALTFGRMGMIFRGASMHQIYAVKSICDDSRNRGYSFSVAFSQQVALIKEDQSARAHRGESGGQKCPPSNIGDSEISYDAQDRLPF